MAARSTDGLAPTLVRGLERLGYVVRPPITPARMRALSSAVGSLPEGVVRYLETSDGFDHPSDCFALSGAKEMSKPYPSNSLLPLHEDGCGNCDAVIVEPGPGFGAVVFFDHETAHASHLVASSVPRYLELLVDFQGVDRWSSDGHSQNGFLRSHDPESARLLRDRAFTRMIGDNGRVFDVVATSEPEPPPGAPLPRGARAGINPFTKQRVVFMPRVVHPRAPPTPTRP